MKPIFLLANISLNVKPRHEVLENVDHLVIPCIAIKEGVLNNIFYKASELEAFATSWNGVPVPVNHPMDANGTSITANSVVCETTVNIGRFYNVTWDVTTLSLKGEIWLNIAKAKKLGYEAVIERLEAGEVMEISTGLYGNTVESKGIHNNVTYDYTISNIMPDHLALLPNSEGACSVKDGCGAMRTNAKKVIDKIGTFFKNIFKNEQSFDDIREGIWQALHAELPEKDWPYILDVFDSYFVYENNQTLYRRSYTLDASNKIILVGENTEVRLERKYVPVSAETITNKKEMNPKKRNAIVNALALAFSVNASIFANHNDEQLSKAADTIKANFDDEGVEIKTNCGCHTPVVPVITTPTVVNGLTTEEKATLARLQANENARLDNKREAVLKANDKLTKEVVATFNEAAMDAILGNVAASVDYTVNGAQPVAATNYKRPSVLLAQPEA